MAVNKIAKNSFQEILSIGRIFGIAILLFSVTFSFGIKLNTASPSFINISRQQPGHLGISDLTGEQFSNSEFSGVAFEASASVPAPVEVPVCEGGNKTFSVTPGSSTYLWQVSTDGGSTWNPTGGTSAAFTLNGIPYSFNGYQYWCVIDFGLISESQSSIYSLAVTQYPAAAGIISGTVSSVCQGDLKKTYSVTSIANATTYLWTLPSGASFVFGEFTNSIVVNFSTSANSGMLTVKGNNACGDGGASNASVTVNPLPVTAGTITGTTSVCQGATGITYSVDPIANATGYVWSVPSGATYTASNTPTPNITVNFSNTASSGNITVYGTNSCGNGATATLAVTVNPLVAAAGVIAGSTPVCQGGSAYTYQVPAIANADSYIWAYSGNGATITGTGNSVVASFSTSATAGNMTVMGTNVCGNGLISPNLAVTVSSLPSAAGTILGPAAATVCQGAVNLAYSVPPISNATFYDWSYSGTNSTITSGTSINLRITFATNATNGNLKVSGRNACGNGTVSANYPVVVNPLPAVAGTIAGTSTVCQGQTSVAYTVPAISNATTYIWNYSGLGATVTGTTNNVTITFSPNATAGDLTVYGQNACGDGVISSNFPITVDPLPAAAGQIAGPPAANVCQGANTLTFAVPLIANAIGYEWIYTGTGATISATTIVGSSANVTINFSVNASSGDLTVRGTNSCGNGVFSNTYPVVVNPLPLASGVITGTPTVCAGQSGVNYSVDGIAYASFYEWHYSGTGATFVDGTQNININFSPTATSGNLTISGRNACGYGSTSLVYPIAIIGPPVSPVPYAGASNPICEGTTFYTITDATATNHSTLLWTSSGTGYFTNQTLLNPTYFPSAADVAAGSVVLRLTAHAISPCTNSVFSTQTLTIRSKPIVEAGPDGLICKGGVFTTSGATASNTQTTSWSGGDGSFNNPSLPVAVYTPGPNDIASGGVTLTLTGTSISPCSVTVTDHFYLAIVPFPTASAGSNASICANSTYSVSGASASNYSSLNWTTSGSGNFSDSHVLLPVYTPSAADISLGTVTLTLTALPKAPCPGPVSSTMLLTINPLATVNAGANAVVCQGGSYTIFDAVAADYTTIHWRTNGTGTFNNENSTKPTYSPSTEDVTAGSVILTAAVTSVAPCLAPIEDFLVLTVTPLPLVYAGPAGSTCGNNAYPISQATALHAASLQWTTSGNGIFSNSSQINPTYTPSTTDIAAGHVDLTLTGISGTACTSNTSSTFRLSISSPPTANAGADASFCETVTYTLHATVTNETAIYWTSNGTGILTGGNTGTPVYTPSAADIVAGSVKFTVHASAFSPCIEATDDVVVSIFKKPVVSVGPDVRICSESNFQITAASAQNSASLSWTTSDGTGTFSNTNTLLPVYIPSPGDITSGHVHLKLTAQPVSPCGTAASAEFMLTFVSPTTANAGPDRNICEKTPNYTISGASSNSSNIYWISSGTGGFVSGTTLTPTYTPSAADIAAGSVVLSMHAEGTSPCPEVIDEMTLFISYMPTVSAGASASICYGNTYTVGDARATNYSGLLWTTSGTGSLADNNSLNPTYLPGTGEIGPVTLTLTVDATSPCTGQVSASKIITIFAAPTANAGPDAQVCQPNTYTINGASATNAGSINWTSSGSGTYTGNGTLTPTYHPSSADFAAGQVTLTLQANGLNSCSSVVTDNMVLTLISTPTAYAGINAIICQGGSYAVSGATVTHYSSFRWTTSGLGTISFPSSALAPVYTAAPGETGSVTLTLTARPNSPCAADAVDQMIISIQPPPTANAGIDGTVCENTNYILTGTATNYASYAWATNGSGIFTGINSLNPAYIPSAADAIAGSVNFTLTAVANSPCGTNVSDVMTLTVVSKPVVNAGSDATICAANSYDLSLATTLATATHTASTVWTTSGDGTFTNTGLLQPTYTPGTGDIAAGQVRLTLTGQPNSSCAASVSDFLILTISNLPTANAGPPTVSICKEGYTLTGAAASNYSSVAWSGGTGTLTNANTLTPTYTPSSTEIASGTVTLTLTVTGAAPCGGVATDTIILLIKPAAPSISVLSNNATTFCEGGSITLTGAPSGYNYNWSPGGATSQNKIVTASGNYRVVITDPITGCSSLASNAITVIVNPSPRLSSSLTPPGICSGTSFTYTPSSSTTGTSFSWIRPIVTGISNAQASGGSGVDPNEILVNTTTSTISVTYIYYLTANGCSYTQNVNVQVSPSPVLTSTLTPPSICSNSSFSYIPTSSTPGATFNWTRTTVPGILNSLATGTGNPNEVLYNSTANPVDVTYQYNLSIAGCTNPVSTNVVVRVNPTPSLTSSLSPNPICSGDIFAYTASSSPAGASMNWSRAAVSGITQPATNGLGNISEYLTNTTGLPINVTYVYTTTLNGCSSKQNVVVTVNPMPRLSSSLAIPPICSGSALNYTATSLTSGAIFVWSRATVTGISEIGTPGTGSVNEVLTNITSAPVQVAYQYTITANGCTNSVPYTVLVTVQPIPTTPVVTVTGSIPFCEGSSITLTSTIASSYEWSNGKTTQSIDVTTAGSYSVVAADVAGCHSAPSIPVAALVNPAPSAPVSGGDITECIASSPQTLTAKATAPAGCIVKWYTEPVGGALIAPPALPTLSGLGFRTYYAESVNILTSCASLTRTAVSLNIVVHPAAPVAEPDIVECAQSPIQTLTAIATVPTGMTIKWYKTAAGGSPVSPILNSVSTVFYYAETNNGSCASLTRTKVTLTINPTPTPPVALGNITDCEKSPIQTLTALSSDPAAVWYTSPSGGSPVSPVWNSVGTVTYYAESILGACPSLTRSAGVVLTIKSIPEAPTVPADPYIECEKSPLQTLTATATAPSGSTVKWYTTATGGVTVASPTLNTIKSVTYYAESDNGNCKSLTRTPFTLQILAAPKAPIAGLNVTECESVPQIQTLTASASFPSGTTISWFSTLTGGDPVTPYLDQVGTVTYYAETSATNGCISVVRSAPVVLTINPTPKAPVGIDVTECPTKPLQLLTAAVIAPIDGSTTAWYNTLLGGSAVPSPILKAVGSKIYYAESKLGKCVNPTRTPVTLTILNVVADPILIVKGQDSIVSCESVPLVPLSAGDLFTPAKDIAIVCFDTATGGSEVSSKLDFPGSVTLYAAAKDTITGCLSFNRVKVRLSIHSAPPAPVSTGDISECALKPVQTLDAKKSIVPLTTSNVVWYDKATGGTVVVNPILAKTDTTVVYYAENVDKVTKCVSLTRTAVILSIISTTASAASNSPIAMGATLNLKGGPESPGNTYLWTDPSGMIFTTMDVSIPSVTASAAGKYTLTVTSLNGCVATDSVNVQLDIAHAETQGNVCIGSTLYLSAFPDKMKSYAWTGPNGYISNEQNPAIFNVTMANAGTYTLTVTNQSGISSQDTVSVFFKPLPIPVAEYTTVCPAGKLQLNGGPNGMTSYLWTGPNGSNWPQQKPPVMDFPTPAANFTLTVVDWNGCEASKTITPVPFQPKATANGPLCLGDTLRLRGEPNGMLSYTWRNPSGVVFSTLQSPTLNNTTLAGDYTLTVVDKDGCTYSTKVTVIFNPIAPVPTITPSLNPICEGATLTLSSTPAGMAAYEWTGPNGFTSTLQDPTIIAVTALEAGKYSLRITTPAGCKNYAETNIVVNAVTFNGNYGPYCIGDTPVTLSAIPTGGTFAGAGINGNTFDPKVAGVGSHNIIYTYSLGGGACTINSTKIIVVVSVPNLVITNPILQSCSGTTADITAPEVTAGSTPGLNLTYWKDSKATIALTTPKSVGAGPYFIKGATPSGKCFDIQPVMVTQPDSLRATLTALSVLNCAGDTTGSMSANVTMGTAPFTYQWSTQPAQSTATATGLKSGIYTVIITDAKGCTSAFTGEIAEPSPIKLSFATKPIQCLSDANGSARVDSINGSGDVNILNSYKYLWNTIPPQTTREAVRLTAWWHKVEVTSSKGCVQKDSVFIDVLDTVPPTIVCPKDIEMTVSYIKSLDGSPNKYVVDLGKPFTLDNCQVDTLTNDAPVKFRKGTTYVVWTVTDQVGLTDTCTQKVYIKEIPTIPQLISPNGDGVNDTFIIDGLNSIEYSGSQMTVFTRSGQLVFQSSSYELPENAWDGRYAESSFNKNKLVAPGVYYYILKLGGTGGQTLKGYIYVYY